MTFTTITAKNGIEEIAGKSLREVLALAARLGHGWPHRSAMQKGVWVNAYKSNRSSERAA